MHLEKRRPHDGKNRQPGRFGLDEDPQGNGLIQAWRGLRVADLDSRDHRASELPFIQSAIEPMRKKIALVFPAP
jgi:hypothetical protein